MSLVVREQPDAASARAFDAFAARFLGAWYGVGQDLRTGGSLRHWLRWTVPTPGNAVLASEGTLEPGSHFTHDLVCPMLDNDVPALLRQASFRRWYDWMIAPAGQHQPIAWATRDQPLGFIRFRETIEPIGDDMFVSTWQESPPGHPWRLACVLTYQRVAA